MKVLKDIQKFCSANKVLCLIGVIAIVVAISGYSMNKGLTINGMSGNRQHSADEVINQVQADNNVQASEPLGENSDFQNVSGIKTSQSAPGCSRKSMEDPAALLPKDSNSAWSNLNPTGQGNLNEINLLNAGHHVGIDTVGNSLRNANLQVRSEPANPQINIGPWNNTTIEPDVMRVPLEIGQGPR